MPHQLAPILSAEPAEGFDGMRPRRTVVGSATTGINQLLVVTTGDSTGTGERISLRITDADGFRVVEHTFPGKARELSRTSTHLVPVRLTFSKAELVGGGITLSNTGPGAWQPESFYVFGLFRSPSASNHPIVVVPLVSIPVWTHGTVSTDRLTGTRSITLPTN